MDGSISKIDWSIRRAICMIVIALVCRTSTAGGQALENSHHGHSIFGPEFSFSEPDQIFATQPVLVHATKSGHDDELISGVLPDGLLYRSYIAGPHESRFASVANYDVGKKSWRWDSALGGRVGLFREGQPDFLNLDAWQIDLEGAAFPRLNPESEMDVESIDYRFGLLWTGKRDNVAVKFGYFHVSSHVGDEYLLSNPTFQRINFVRESIVLGTSVQATSNLRCYGEVAWAMVTRGGAKPWQFQFGSEYSEANTRPNWPAPFSAVNIQLREEVDFAAGVTVMSGWQWKGPESGRTMRIGLQYYNGPSNQYEFLRRYDNQLGLGTWFDY